MLQVAFVRRDAKRWGEDNPRLSISGDMSDPAALTQFNSLTKIEGLNSVMIKAVTSKEKRFEMLRKMVISQYQRLSLHARLKGLEG